MTQDARESTSRKRRGLKRTGGSVYSLTEDETYELGRTFGLQLSGGDLILLDGPLGVGKTVFARGVATGLEIPPEQVCSPSYTLVQEYTGGRVRMYHVDLYRIEAVEEVGTLGIEELLDSGSVVVVEWGDRLPLAYRRDGVTVRFHDIGEASRRIEILAAAEPTGDH